MKRLLYLGIVVTLLLMLPAFAGAQSLEQGFLHQIGYDGNTTITAYVGTGSDVVIPNQIAGRLVTVIGDEAFSDNSQLMSVVIPEGVFSIGKAAFQNCLNLASVSLPSTLRVIGENAFNSCAKLEKIVIPNKVTAIADGTFFRCLQLKDVTFPAGLKSIGRMAFAVTGLEKLELPDSLETIDVQAFYGNRNLGSVILPNGIQRIEEFAFFVCDNLTSVILPAGLTSLSSCVFDKCPKLEMIAIPRSVRQIKDDALFSGLLRPTLLKVYGASGSEAENYARRVGLPFGAVAVSTGVRITLNDQDIAGRKLAIDLSSNDKTLSLQAAALPETLWPGVRWNSSSSKIAAVDSYGLVYGLMKGEVTITASAIDGSGVQASFQLNIANLAKSISISGETAVPAKGKVALNAVVLPAATDNKSVDWSVSDSSVASVSKSGVVTAGDVARKQQLIVTATAKDGSGVSGTYQLTVNPLVSSVGLSLGGQPLENKASLAIDLASGQAAVQLFANVMPADAIQRVTWESSSPKVATVSDDGLVTGLKKGKTTITARSTDGTRKTASCTLNVARLAKEIILTGDNAVTSGKSITLKALVLPETTDNKKVVWSSSDEAVAKVSRSGAVTAKKTAEKREVTITAAADDGSGVASVYVVTVHPEAAGVVLMMDRLVLEPKAALVIDLSSSVTSLQLGASVLPGDAAQGVSWKSSDARVASVDENGLVTGLRKGTATITATTADGTRRRASCVVTVANPPK